MRMNVDTARDRIVRTLRQQPATREALRKSPYIGFSDLPWINIALEELQFERLVSKDENEHYFLTNNNFPCNEIQQPL